MKTARAVNVDATLNVERDLLRSGHTTIAGIDEVGRGSLAGPVTVGVAVVNRDTAPVPVGLRDSKLLTVTARERMVGALQEWVCEYAVAHSSPAEIDELGIIGALRLAGQRALAALTNPVDVVILDGSSNWLSGTTKTTLATSTDSFHLDSTGPGTPGLDSSGPGTPGHGSSGLGASGRGAAAVGQSGLAGSDMPQVLTMVKADQRCASVAAASVLAKVERDGILTELAKDFPHYGWQKNKGYSAAAHVAALREYGPCQMHRRSWRLPGVEVIDVAKAGAVDAGRQNP